MTPKSVENDVSSASGRPGAAPNLGHDPSDVDFEDGWRWDLPEASRPRGPHADFDWTPQRTLTLALAGFALVLWMVSLPFVQVGRLSGWGLLTGLPVGWYAAYAAALAALVIAVGSRTVEPRLLIPAFGALLLILYATTSVTYGAPRYAWTYKHIGVTEYLLKHGTPALDVDIYQNFPGFFYTMGGLHLVTHVPVLVMARYAEVVSTAANAAAFYWALGAITRSTRVRWLSVILLTFTNWLGQTYFAPQAFVFPLALLVVGMMLRMICRGRGQPKPGRQVSLLPPQSDFWSGRWAVSICLLLFALVVCSHQFTPVALLLQAGALVLLFRLRRPWIVVAFSVMEALWLVHAAPYISRHFSFIDVSGYDNIRPPAALPAVLPGAAAIAQVPHIITLFVGVGTIAGVVLSFRRTRSLTEVLLPAVLAATPAVIVLAQPYGQEGILRVYLFAVPWCSLVIARDLLRVESWEVRPRLARAAVAVVGVLGLLAVPSVLGTENVNYVSPPDVAADQWFENNTPAGSELLLVVPAYPSRSTGNYDRHLLLDDPLSPALLRDVPGFESSTTSGQDLLAFTKSYVVSRRADHDVYLAIGPTQYQYALLYGLVTRQALDDYLEDLRTDPAFELVYGQDQSYVFRAL